MIIYIAFDFSQNLPHLLVMEPVSKKRKKWDNSNMVSAMEAVSSKSMNVSKAARHYSVPRKSLENRIKNRTTHGINPGPSRVLSTEEEEGLVEYIKYMAKGGFL